MAQRYRIVSNFQNGETAPTLLFDNPSKTEWKAGNEYTGSQAKKLLAEGLIEPWDLPPSVAQDSSEASDEAQAQDDDATLATGQAEADGAESEEGSPSESEPDGDSTSSRPAKGRRGRR